MYLHANKTRTVSNKSMNVYGVTELSTLKQATIQKKKKGKRRVEM